MTEEKTKKENNSNCIYNPDTKQLENVHIESAPKGTSKSIINKIIWGESKHFYDK